MQKKPNTTRKYEFLPGVVSGPNITLLRGNTWWTKGENLCIGSSKNLSQLGDSVIPSERDRAAMTGMLGRGHYVCYTGRAGIFQYEQLAAGTYRYCRSQ